jgi:hypothetical protein
MKLTILLLGAAIALPAAGQSTNGDNRTYRAKIDAEVQGRLAAEIKGKMAAYTEIIDLNSAGRVVTRAPYSAVVVSTSTQTLADGNRIVRSTEVRTFRDSEGRTRREQNLKKIGPWEPTETTSIVTIADPVGNFRLVLHPESRTADKNSMSPSNPERERRSEEEHKMMMAKMEAERSSRALIVGGAREQTAQRQQLGDRVIEGVTAHGTRTVHTIAAGEIGNERPIEIVSESWYSDELQTVVLSRQSDPRIGETEYKLTQIQRGEQPRYLFEAPANYTVREPPAKLEILRK